MNKIKTEIKWAIIFAIITLVWMLLEKLVGLHGKNIDYHFYLTNLFIIPFIVVIVLALKDKKKNFYNGSMSYLQGLISGVILSLFIALLSPLTQWITSFVISPEYFPNVINRSVELGYFKTIAEAEMNFNYKSYAINVTVFSLFFGVITSVISMVFLKTKTK